MRSILERVLRYLAFLRHEYGQDRCGQAAAALAFGTLLSIVPLAALLAWLLRPFHQDFKAILNPLTDYLLPTPELQAVIQTNIERYADNAGNMGLFGLFFFFFVAWGMLMSVESIINDIWHVKKRRGRGHKLTTFWATVIAAPLLFVASATLNQGLSRALFLGGLEGKAVSKFLLQDALPFLLLVISLGMGYWILPHTHVRKRAAGIGALVAAVLYHFARLIFVQYLNYVSTFDRIYGILWVVPAFLMWLFFVWSVVLIGAEVCYTVDNRWEKERG